MANKFYVNGYLHDPTKNDGVVQHDDASETKPVLTEQIVGIGLIETADASDATTTQALANELKATVNLLLEHMVAAGIMDEQT